MSPLRTGDVVVVEFGSGSQHIQAAVIMSPDTYLVSGPPQHVVVVPCGSPAVTLPSDVAVMLIGAHGEPECFAAQAELVRAVKIDCCTSIIGNVGPGPVQRIGAILRMLIAIDP